MKAKIVTKRKPGKIILTLHYGEIKLRKEKIVPERKPRKKMIFLLHYGEIKLRKKNW